jgi:predicted HTH transcriptional regulator
MAEWTAARLTDVFGAPLPEVTAEHVEGLVTNSAREDSDLEFKRTLYADTGDLAGDLAAMANDRGGVIVLGIEEDDGVARRYFYRFDNPLLQPYVILSGLAQDLIDEELVRRAQERSTKPVPEQTRLTVDGR